jgi:hypothetical protein
MKSSLSEKIEEMSAQTSEKQDQINAVENQMQLIKSSVYTMISAFRNS